MNRGLILFVLLLIVCTVWGDTAVSPKQPTTTPPPLAFLGQEAYEPASREMANTIVDEWRARGIKMSKNSVRKVGLIQNEQTPPTRENMVLRLMGRTTYAARASAVPMIVFTGGAMVKGKRVHVVGRGETKDAAMADAQQGLRDIGENLVKYMRFEGLLVE